MNIFYLDHNPVIAARYLNDKHVIKMVLESVQMLSTAHRMLDGVEAEVYRATDNKYIKKMILPELGEFRGMQFDDRRIYWNSHENHPCNVWVRQSRTNYGWLLSYTLEAFREYARRYKKFHASAPLMQHLIKHPKNIPNGPLTSPAQAMPDEYKCEDPVAAYRTYYIQEKLSFSRWHKQIVPPPWIVSFPSAYTTS